jgi:polysaccharide export outer membrane protein
MARRRLAVLAALILGAGAIAAAQENKPGTAPAPDRVEAPKAPSSINSDTAGLPIDPKTYVIGDEDLLKITIWREPDLSKGVQVRPDGKITMNLVGDVQASGLTPERLAAQLREAYHEKILNPEISVEVIQVNSKRYSITGGINHPGTFPLVVPMKVFDALNLAGGFRDFANKTDIRIIRGNGGTILHFNYKDYVAGKKKAIDQNVFLENGDTIYVKE